VTRRNSQREALST